MLRNKITSVMDLDRATVTRGEAKRMCATRASVIVCAYTLERLHDIHEAVSSVMAQTMPAYELIVAVDHNRELLDRLRLELPPPVRLVLNEGTRGLSATRNVGVCAAGGDIVAFMDDDAIAGPEWLARLVDAFAEPQVAAVGGKILPLWLGKGSLLLPDELGWIVGCTYRGFADGRCVVRNVHGCNMSFRRQVYQDVGYFRTVLGHSGNLLGGEETEFCIRITSAYPGSQVVYEPSAVVYHKVPGSRQTYGHLVRRAYGEGVSKAFMQSMTAERGLALADEGRFLRLLLTDVLWGSIVMMAKGRLLDGARRALAGALTLAATGVGYTLTRLRLSLSHWQPQEA